MGFTVKHILVYFAGYTTQPSLLLLVLQKTQTMCFYGSKINVAFICQHTLSDAVKKNN
jgi:hypothetical protein